MGHVSKSKLQLKIIFKIIFKTIFFFGIGLLVPSKVVLSVDFAGRLVAP